ncbi:heat-shock protein [Hydrogenophaga crassostreae]|uniref:Heat-shock protein n=1 Tax=Hydrogenophaga crassostreae TaxID=1763535 RepID=A0A170AIY8_9BURK|nr:Hsp70 family protein [Hydrogenophaga crassostreae]AOW13967.1 heat-shock protein [Hydrogenophaga crassostreae]OAD44069.1 heat-shock protein [Hydrogenophaga crassostreae]
MTPSTLGTLGIDFGTSNSAVSWANHGESAQLIPLEGDALNMPTAVFFNAEDQCTHFGRDAVSEYLSGTEGRMMRSLKSLLGSPLLLETTEVNGHAVSFLDIVAIFLAELRERASIELGDEPTRVVMGRPVHFVDDSPERDALAQNSLEEAAYRVGFEHVSFQLEPIAAALDYERRLQRESLVLVVDIGGGTSDFTVVRLGPEHMQKTNRNSDILATSGVHIGGTDFDQKLSLGQVMPLLGYRHLGPEGREVPHRVFLDLSTWHLIQWQYLPRALSQAQNLRTNYSDQKLHQRLMKVLHQREGHRIAYEVEQAKIRCSVNDAATSLDLSFLEAGLSAGMAPGDMQEHLAAQLARTVACARECVQRAGLTDSDLSAVYLTGGSSALLPFQRALQAAFPGVALVEGDLFGGVASGLAYSK